MKDKGPITIEIYSPPGCVKCGDRAYRQIIGKTEAYCLHHWIRLPGHELVSEYEEHMNTLREKNKSLTAINKELLSWLVVLKDWTCKCAGGCRCCYGMKAVAEQALKSPEDLRQHWKEENSEKI